MSGWKVLRIGILLLILGSVALDAWLTRLRTTDWDAPLRVALYPVAADSSPVTREYISNLTPEDFSDIGTFFAAEGRHHGLALTEPVRITLGRTLAELPPLPPADRSLFGTVWWSLKLRWWSRRIESDAPRPRSQVRVYVLFYDPATHSRVSHSLGLQKGLIGIVHAFASRAQGPTNNFVIAHELLHTLGATDKYDPATGLPRFPEGYAQPDANPRYPQASAELMGGRIPKSGTQAEIPVGLGEVLVGQMTAREIGWVVTP